jgi:hypothetical protein
VVGAIVVAAAGGVDVLIAGSSTALFDVLPGELDAELAAAGLTATTYNAGITAGLPEITADWLERFALPRATPRVVVWLLNVGDLNDANQLPAAAAYRSSSAVREGFWADLDRWAGRHSELIRRRTVLRDPGAWLDALRGRPDAVERLVPHIGADGGPHTFLLPLNEAALRQAEDIVAELSFDGRNEGIVRDQIARMVAAGIQVVIAEAPMPDRTVALLPDPDADLAAGRALLEAIAADTGAGFVPLADDLRDDDLYQDYTHLAEAGAERFTRSIAPAVGAALEAGPG